MRWVINLFLLKLYNIFNCRNESKWNVCCVKISSIISFIAHKSKMPIMVKKMVLNKVDTPFMLSRYLVLFKYILQLAMTAHQMWKLLKIGGWNVNDTFTYIIIHLPKRLFLTNFVNLSPSSRTLTRRLLRDKPINFLSP